MDPQQKMKLVFYSSIFFSIILIIAGLILSTGDLILSDIGSLMIVCGCTFTPVLLTTSALAVYRHKLFPPNPK